MLTTSGTLLGGRVRYDQPVIGFRSGIEPVLLAASIPARTGDRVLEAGAGAGAALLCLVQRVGAIRATGVEIDPAMARLAAANATANGFDSIEIITGAIETAPLGAGFDHAFSNPPYHRPSGSISPDLSRDVAKRGSPAVLTGWIQRLAGALRHRGSLTLILPAGQAPLCLRIMEDADCRCTALFPLWPKAGREAKLILVRGIRQARAPMRLSTGLVLHELDGSYTAAARAVLEQNSPLSLSDYLSVASG